MLVSRIEVCRVVDNHVTLVSRIDRYSVKKMGVER